MPTIYYEIVGLTLIRHYYKPLTNSVVKQFVSIEGFETKEELNKYIKDNNIKIKGDLQE